jgi:ATP-dependent DNA helicase DinG
MCTHRPPAPGGGEAADVHDWIDRLLGPGGALARQLPGFRPRAEQITMAHAVADALADSASLVCEAGTGTGKTFAYLVPALVSGRRVVVSTGTRALQDQLFHRDLPVLTAVLPERVKVALLKGRANYLCPYRLGLLEDDPARLDPERQGELARIRAWAPRTRSGDLAEVPGLGETTPLRPLVTSTTENCLGGTCPQIERCWVAEARRRAAAADLTVVNHHLLLADMALRDEGFTELLPGVNAVIADEAHQLTEVARAFFGDSLSVRQLQDLARDAEAAALAEAADTPDLPARARGLVGASRDLRLVFEREEGRGALLDPPAALPPALDLVTARLGELAEAFSAVAERAAGLDGIARRAEQMQGLVLRFTQILGEPAPEELAWYETRGQGLALHRSPLDVAAPFRARQAELAAAFVYTSATLAVGEDFGHFARELGLVEPRTLRLGSPYDYPRQTLLWLPSIGCLPSERGYTEAVVAVVLPLLEALAGRAFLLFTSHRALTEAARHLAGRGFRLFVQGQAAKGQLLEAFVATPRALLLGTQSFWEGVDVRGAALSCVIIDKLPFAAPDDPVLEARIRRVKEEGGDPFRSLQLPRAVLALKQGVGRLIRDPEDRGILVLCDPRLTGRGYGRLFLDALPPMPRTRDPAEVLAFARSLAPAEAAAVPAGG